MKPLKIATKLSTILLLTTSFSANASFVIFVNSKVAAYAGTETPEAYVVGSREERVSTKREPIMEQQDCQAVIDFSTSYPSILSKFNRFTPLTDCMEEATLRISHKNKLSAHGITKGLGANIVSIEDTTSHGNDFEEWEFVADSIDNLREVYTESPKTLEEINKYIDYNLDLYQFDGRLSHYSGDFIIGKSGSSIKIVEFEQITTNYTKVNVYFNGDFEEVDFNMAYDSSGVGLDIKKHPNFKKMGGTTKYLLYVSEYSSLLTSLPGLSGELETMDCDGCDSISDLSAFDDSVIRNNLKYLSLSSQENVKNLSDFNGYSNNKLKTLIVKSPLNDLTSFSTMSLSSTFTYTNLKVSSLMGYPTDHTSDFCKDYVLTENFVSNGSDSNTLAYNGLSISGFTDLEKESLIINCGNTP